MKSTLDSLRSSIMKFPSRVKVYLQSDGEELRNARQRLEEASKRIKRLRQQLARKNRKIEELQDGAESDNGERGVSPKNIVWIIGSPRTGSTWLGNMLAGIKGCRVWQEPFFGVILSFRDNIANQGWASSTSFLFGDPNKPIWLSYMRRLFLAVGRERFGAPKYLVVKEPNGSMGARLILEAFPESKLVFLVRDPRDVVASLLDAAKPGSWYGYERYEAAAAAARFEPETGSFAFAQPPAEEEYVEHLARDVAASFAAARDAFEAHNGYKILVRYEDLRADTLGTMKKICSTLGLTADEGRLVQAVEKRSWENLPAEKKGQGKANRKATPGGWREELTPEQARVVERTNDFVLREFYPEQEK